MSVKTYSLKKDGNKKLSTNFIVSEFKCKDGSDTILVDTELIDLLQKIRTHFNKPVTINSAYRNATYNKKIGGATSSQHVYGTAADIVVKDTKPEVVAQYVEFLMPKKGGIGLYPTFTHVDVRATRARWKNFNTEVGVSGFPGYTESAPTSSNPEPFTYHIEGTTHIIEIDPRNIWAVETQCSTKKVTYNNFVNSVFFMNLKSGKTHPQGIIVNAGKVIANNPTHGKPVATLIVHGKNDVEMKYVSDITKEKNVWFAISGYGIYPNITAAEEGFTGQFSDVTRSTNRPIIGYRKKDNKIVIAVRASTSADRAKTTAKNLGLDFAISLDGGGSTTLKVDGKYKFSGDGRTIFGGIIWA